MTKKELIKQELQSVISVPYAMNYTQQFGMAPEKTLQFQTIAIVDLDKLAEFLSKYIEIKAEDLIN